MSWRVLDLSGFQGKLSYQRGHVSVTPEGAVPSLVNLKEVAVILCGSKVSISSGLLLKLSENGISLLVSDWKYVPVGAFQSWSKHTRVGARQNSQAKLSTPRAKSAWASVVKAKIAGQSEVQKSLDNTDVQQKLLKLSRSVRSGDPENIEGHAAQLHWRHFVHDTKFTRDQQSSDPLNSCLNYGYTILRGYCIRSILQAGLWPALGIFHHGRSNAFCLADDFIEPFRPVVDYLVTTLPSQANLTDSATKRTLASAAEVIFQDDGMTVSTAITQLARDFGRYVEGDIKRFEPPSWVGADALQV